MKFPYSFEYQIIGKDDWHPKARTWKTFSGARKAADNWIVDMAAENCPVRVRMGKIFENRFVEIKE